MTILPEPHGGALINLMAEAEQVDRLKSDIKDMQSWDLSPRQICDLELLLIGGFSPLSGFMSESEYLSVCNEMRLSNGLLWPMPINLDVNREFAENLSSGEKIALRNPEGIPLAIMEVTDKWEPDRNLEALKIFNTNDLAHPGVKTLLDECNPIYLGGGIQGLQLPPHHDFDEIRHTPFTLRQRFESKEWTKIVAFQTRNPMHRAHVELTKRASEETGAKLLIHPVVGLTKPGDVDYFVRVRAYRAMLSHYENDSAELSLLPLAMRMGGPREAIWHAIIRKNYGCTHFIVGRDHAGPGNDSEGNPFYGAYEAQDLLRKHSNELGIDVAEFKEMVYVYEDNAYLPVSEVDQAKTTLNLSGTELRQKLMDGTEIPEWFSFPEVVSILRDAYPPKNKQGFTIFFTGLPSSGKSTLANVLMSRLMEITSRPVTLLDGDLVRKNLSSELGFSKEHRDLNIKRIGYVASEITKHRGIAICAPIAPYSETREEIRSIIEQYGKFILIHVATPLEICELRDLKGLYAKARAGQITGFTGIDDPYESPESPELRIDTSMLDPKDAIENVMKYLEGQGLLDIRNDC